MSRLHDEEFRRVDLRRTQYGLLCVKWQRLLTILPEIAKSTAGA